MEGLLERDDEDDSVDKAISFAVAPPPLALAPAPALAPTLAPAPAPAVVLAPAPALPLACEMGNVTGVWAPVVARPPEEEAVVDAREMADGVDGAMDLAWVAGL